VTITSMSHVGPERGARWLMGGLGILFSGPGMALALLTGQITGGSSRARCRFLDRRDGLGRSLALDQGSNAFLGGGAPGLRA
jgi:hypothetical protein